MKKNKTKQKLKYAQIRYCIIQLIPDEKKNRTERRKKNVTMTENKKGKLFTMKHSYHRTHFIYLDRFFSEFISTFITK